MRRRDRLFLLDLRWQRQAPFSLSPGLDAQISPAKLSLPTVGGSVSE
jgi:hypothetical protein